MPRHVWTGVTESASSPPRPLALAFSQGRGGEYGLRDEVRSASFAAGPGDGEAVGQGLSNAGHAVMASFARCSGPRRVTGDGSAPAAGAKEPAPRKANVAMAATARRRVHVDEAPLMMLSSSHRRTSRPWNRRP